MTVQVKKNIRALRRQMRQNAPKITRKLAKSGMQVHSKNPVVISVAKYYTALSKLASE